MIDELRERTGLLLAAIVAAALALRLACLGKFAYFIDEVHALLYTRGPFLEAMRRLPDTPGTAPLDYALVNLLQRVSDSETFMRLPFALMGAYTVYAVYRLAARHIGPSRALAAAALMAIAPAHIFYSQSIRNYSLSILLIVLIADAYDGLLRDGDRRNGMRFAAYSLIAVLNQFLMFIPIGFLFVHAAAAYGSWSSAGGKKKKNILFGLALTAALLAIAALLNIRLILSPQSLSALSRTGTAGGLTAQTLLALIALTSFHNTTLNVIALLLSMIGLVSLLFRARPLFWIIFAAAVLPLPVIVFQELRLRSDVHLRHIIFMQPFYFMAVAQGLYVMGGFVSRRLRRWRVSPDAARLALAALVLLALFSQTARYYREPYGFRGGTADMRPDLKTPAIKLAGVTNSNDVLVSTGFAHGAWRYVMNFYLERMGAPRRWVDFTELSADLRPPARNGRVLFVYFDFPYTYTRDFSSPGGGFKAVRLNSFITLFEPERPARVRADLVERARAFALITAPPMDFGIFSHAYLNLGVAARLSGDYAAAERYQRRAVAMARRSPLNIVFEEIESREALGGTYAARGEYGRAREQWAAAAALLPRRASRALLDQVGYRPERLYTRLAGAERNTGDTARAIHHARAALGFNPNYEPAKNLLRRIEPGGVAP